MTGTTFLQAFLFLDVFIIGFVAAIALRHANAHFRPQKHEALEKAALPDDTKIPLSPAMKERLLQDSQEQFQAAINHSASFLQHDLEATSEQINILIKRLATELVSNELERYRTELAQLHTQAQTNINDIKHKIAGHQAELQAQLAQEIEAEKQQLIKQINTKLSDAVGSFLLETLEHNIDLGTQGPYLMAMLEEHKADFIQEVASEA